MSFCEETSDIGQSLSSAGQDTPPSGRSSDSGSSEEVAATLGQFSPTLLPRPSLSRKKSSFYSLEQGDISSPLTEVDPDYESSTESDSGHSDLGGSEENIYEQVLNCRSQMPSYIKDQGKRIGEGNYLLPSQTLESRRSPPPGVSHRRIELKERERQRGSREKERVEREEREEREKREESTGGLKERARQLKQTLSAKFSVRTIFLQKI